MSLSDVERAMIVFEYMYEMMGVFGPLMDQWAKKEMEEMKENGGITKVRIYSIYGVHIVYRCMNSCPKLSEMMPLFGKLVRSHLLHHCKCNADS